MGRKKYHTLLIMPSAPGKRIIKFSLPSFCWRFFYAAAVVLFVWAGVGTWSIYSHYQIMQRSQELEKESQVARSQLERERQKVKYLNQELNKIREKSVFIQNCLEGFAEFLHSLQPFFFLKFLLIQLSLV